MKEPKISQRQSDLQNALEHCTSQQSLQKQPLFNYHDRWMINQERSRLWQNDTSWEQLPKLESKIQKALKELKIEN